MGKLIAIEGVDGSGKETQTALLYDRLLEEGLDVMKRGYPNYDSEASALVKMYLMGKFGDDPKSVNAYIASTFFAGDRYADFMTVWKGHYEGGGIVLVDRYTTANMIHQAGKIKDPAERDRFLNWLYDFEFKLYGIPVPDLVFFLDVPSQFQQAITAGRKNKITGGTVQDIHEKSPEHLQESYAAASYVAEKYGWQKIQCVRDGKMRSIESINDEIFDKVSALLHLARID